MVAIISPEQTHARNLNVLEIDGFSDPWTELVGLASYLEKAQKDSSIAPCTFASFLHTRITLWLFYHLSPLSHSFHCNI